MKNFFFFLGRKKWSEKNSFECRVRRNSCQFCVQSSSLSTSLFSVFGQVFLKNLANSFIFFLSLSLSSKFEIIIIYCPFEWSGHVCRCCCLFWPILVRPLLYFFFLGIQSFHFLGIYTHTHTFESDNKKKVSGPCFFLCFESLK